MKPESLINAVEWSFLRNNHKLADSKDGFGDMVKKWHFDGTFLFRLGRVLSLAATLGALVSLPKRLAGRPEHMAGLNVDYYLLSYFIRMLDKWVDLSLRRFLVCGWNATWTPCLFLKSRVGYSTVKSSRGDESRIIGTNFQFVLDFWSKKKKDWLLHRFCLRTRFHSSYGGSLTRLMTAY